MAICYARSSESSTKALRVVSVTQLYYCPCQQAPAPVAAAPADSTTPVAAPTPPPQVIVEESRPRVIEENPPRVGVDIDIHKQQNRDHEQQNRDHVAVDLHAHQ